VPRGVRRAQDRLCVVPTEGPTVTTGHQRESQQPVVGVVRVRMVAPPPALRSQEIARIVHTWRRSVPRSAPEGVQSTCRGPLALAAHDRVSGAVETSRIAIAATCRCSRATTLSKAPRCRSRPTRRDRRSMGNTSSSTPPPRPRPASHSSQARRTASSTSSRSPRLPGPIEANLYN
jgi:hypothetical protein